MRRRSFRPITLTAQTSMGEIPYEVHPDNTVYRVTRMGRRRVRDLAERQAVLGAVARERARRDRLDQMLTPDDAEA